MKSRFSQKISKWLLTSALALSLTAGSAMATTYVIDQAHSQVGFEVDHLVISEVEGQFSQFEGSMEINEKTKALSNIQAKIYTNSIDTDQKKRDDHLRSPDFFDTANHPHIMFKSTGVTSLGKNLYQVQGSITIRGVTKKITLEGKMSGMINDSYFGKRAGFKAEGVINRQDFGLKWSKMTEAGGLVVGDEVTLVIRAEMVVKK